MIHQYEGTITVDSEVAVGSVFTIRLKLQPIPLNQVQQINSKIQYRFDWTSAENPNQIINYVYQFNLDFPRNEVSMCDINFCCDSFMEEERQFKMNQY